MTIQRLLARLVSFMLLCVIFTQTAFSQTKTITGKILDDKGAPLQGATVTVKGTKQGASTGADGSFTINVPQSANTLTISSVGFANQDVSIASSTTVSVALVPTQAALNEVVVIGYGSVRRKDLTGSVTTVTSKEFNKGVITSPDQLMANKVSGLEVVNNSGQPGSATTIKIRGNSSIYGNGNPLYVVDGVLLDGRNARPGVNLGTGGFGQTPDANPLIYINPNDIADITILKDASSTAIYGSRGANGVVVITTKKATSGPAKLEANISEGWNVGYMKKYDVLDASQFRSALHKYTLDTLSLSLDHGGNVDALKEITQHSTIQNYGLAMSGGNENGKYRASFLASRTPGFIKSNQLDKYIGTFAGSYKFLDQHLSIDFSLIAAHTNENVVLVSNTAGSQGNLISSALQWNPTQAFADANGQYIYPSNGSGNPLALIRGYNDLAKVNTFLGSISATYRIVKGLEYKFLYSNNTSAGTRATNIDGFMQGLSPITGQGLGVNSNAELISQVTQNLLTYRTDITSDLHFDALAGYEYWKSDYNNSNYSALGFNFNNSQANLLNIKYTDVLQDGNAQNLPGVFKDITTQVQSYFARVNFNWFDKYYLTATIRDDGSSKFGANNKYGTFPSFGAMWHISNEDFMKDSKVFSNLSLRGTWGITGSQDFPSGAAIDQFTFNSYNHATQANVGNPNLKWQQTTQWDLGLDFGFLNNRIFGSVDYYNKNTSHILFQGTVIQPGPAATVWLNLPGHLINNGVEVTLGANLVHTRDLSWDITGNFAYNHNTVKNFLTSTGQPYVINTGQINGQGVSGTLGQIITNNQPIDEFFLKPFQGFDQGGNQKVGANPAYAGNPNPTTLFGVSTTVNYKKFGLTVNAGGSGGYVIYNNTATSVTNISGIAQGRNIDLKAYNSAEKPSSGVAASARFLESGNFFKMRNVTLSYSVGNVGSYVKNLNLFVSGTNLFVITKFSGFDPEVNIDKNQNGYPSRSIEYIPYPTPRSITAGLNFTL
ncbi:MAG TPA: SusC/RagA family TonB-linked outer membrane protein [Puia sp.]|uniref:SusC/RagA family TonB-linked outer membrane protein n=1 Tax=Puia sp. TaxID=2045100 RepID=UPI002B868A12|nr:SusC/RagA family TonB-linked outer membrane protein [Puia sp.]HVU94895.1 SusC/RagA family TonB-linked outer membrane protein [Puia sp.]